MKNVGLEDVNELLSELSKQQKLLMSSLLRIQEMGAQVDSFPIAQLRLEEQKVLEAQERIRTCIQFVIPDMERVNNAANRSTSN